MLATSRCRAAVAAALVVPALASAARPPANDVSPGSQGSFVLAYFGAGGHGSVRGTLAPGQPVAVLPASGGVCAAVTGAARVVEDEERGPTELTELTGPCRGPALAIVGTHASAVRRVLHADVSRATRTARVRAIEQADAVRAVLAVAQNAGEGFTVEDVGTTPERAFTLAGVDRSPTFVRFPLAGHPGRGPLVLVRADGVTQTPFSTCSIEPVGFTMAGRTFFWGASTCCACGWRVDTVFEVTRGKLVSRMVSLDGSD